MKNATTLIPRTRAFRLARRAELVKEHQPYLWEAPRYFPRADWYHCKLRKFRAQQNGRKRCLRKALYLKLGYEYKQVFSSQVFSPEDI